MRNRLFASMDALTLVLILLGATLLAISVVGLVVLAQPIRATPEVRPAATPQLEAVLAVDQVATVLRVDASAGAGVAARVGDHVDVLGYFAHHITGDENITRVLVADVPVLSVARAGGGAALTLAVPQATALLLHEAQALGARPFVVLRSDAGALAYPPSLSDSELAARLAESNRSQVAIDAR